MISKFLLLITLLGFSAQALATHSPFTVLNTQDETSQVRLQVQSPLDAPPQPLPPKDAPPQPSAPFNFKIGKQMWDAGVMPSEQDVLGTWIMIGWGDVSLNFANQKNFYNIDGQKNTDGSLSKLTYGWQKDASGQDNFYALYLGLGKKDSNQGPFVATMNRENKSVDSSRYLYRNGSLANSYLGNSCRLTEKDADLLICTGTLHIDASEKSSAIPEQLAYDGVTGVAILYKRMR